MTLYKNAQDGCFRRGFKHVFMYYDPGKLKKQDASHSIVPSLRQRFQNFNAH